MNYIRKTTPSAHAKGVRIGSRYTGRPQAHADTTTGTYWEALPSIGGHALALQQCLLTKPRAPRPRRPLGAAFRTGFGDAATLRCLLPQARSKPRMTPEVHNCTLDQKTGVMRVAA